MTRFPESLRVLVRPIMGEVFDARISSHGHNTNTYVVNTESGQAFIKAVPNRPGGRRDSLNREKIINPYVQSFSPAVLWNTENDEWVALGFDVIDGRAADFTPSSPDLDRVVDTVNDVGGISLPTMAQDWIETRWDRFAVDEYECSLLRGNTLLYTDMNPENFIFNDRTVQLVDWAWPTRGAAFIDPACLVLQLIAAEHDPAEAEAWIERCGAWMAADSQSISVFISATIRMYREFSERNPSMTWIADILYAAQKWESYRG